MRVMKLSILILLPFLSVGCNLPTQVNQPAPSSGTTSIPAAPQVLPTETATTSPLPTFTLAPTLTATASASPTPSVPTAFFLMNANCRSGPSTAKEAVISFLKGDTTEIFGRNDELDDTWWYVQIPDSNGKCWVSTFTVNVIGSYDDIPIIPPPY